MARTDSKCILYQKMQLNGHAQTVLTRILLINLSRLTVILRFLQTGCLNGLRCIAAETCKCNNNLTPEYIRDLVQLKTSPYSFRYENTVKVPTVPTVTYGQCSFRFESARVWNSLPNDMRKVTEFAEFQCQIRSWTVQLVRNRSSCLWKTRNSRTARTADVPPVAVREDSQHVSLFTVIFYF